MSTANQNQLRSNMALGNASGTHLKAYQSDTSYAYHILELDDVSVL